MSVREYYAYKFQIRSTDQSCLLNFARLLQQFAVDMYAKLETQCLDFYRSQQYEIRQVYLQGVADAIASGETDSAKIDLYRFAETDAKIAIGGMVVHRFPIVDISETKSATEYVLVNEEEIPIVLRLWKDMLEDYDPDINTSTNEPVTIIADNLEANTFHGWSLATRPTTYILQNPLLAEHLSLKSWYAENKEKVAFWINNKVYEDISKFFVPPKEEEIMDLTSAYMAFKDVKTCWIKAKVKLSIARMSLFYVVCKNGQMIVDAGFDWSIACAVCSVLFPIEIRLKLLVILGDENNIMRNIIWSPDAEKLCPFTSVEVKEKESQYYSKALTGHLVRRYVILKTILLDETKSSEDQKSSHSGTTVDLDSDDHSNEPANLEAPFFTPTMKNVLDQVEHDNTDTGTSTSHHSATKHHISIGTITPGEIHGLSITIPETTLDAHV